MLVIILRLLLVLVIQLQEDLHEKQKHELKMKEDVENLKDTLRSEKNYLEEIICERDKLRTLCDEKDSALQVINHRYKELYSALWCLQLLIICLRVGCNVGETKH